MRVPKLRSVETGLQFTEPLQKPFLPPRNQTLIFLIKPSALKFRPQISVAQFSTRRLGMRRKALSWLTRTAPSAIAWAAICVS
jgi:hypothetical protein